MQVFSKKSFDIFKSFLNYLLFSELYSKIEEVVFRKESFMSLLFNYSAEYMVILLCIRLLIVFTILPIHEFSHGYAARKLGDNTALISGRLTLNPLAHVDPIGAILLLLFGFGWAKPVPVNPRNFKNYRRDMALTALAGPLSNFICALIAIFANRVIANIAMNLLISDRTYETLGFIVMGIRYFAVINLSLAIFNLIPVEPLDGSRILSYFLPPKANAFIAKYRQYFYIGMMILVFGGLLAKPLSKLIDCVYSLFNLLFFWVDILFKVILR